MSIIVVLSPIHFFLFWIVIYESKPPPFSENLTKVSIYNFKIGIDRISDRLECAKILFLHKSPFIIQLEILSHVALDALRRSYLNQR